MACIEPRTFNHGWGRANIVRSRALLSYSGTARDTAGNVSTATTDTVNVDATAPTVTITMPTRGSYVLSQVISANYTCDVQGSGIACCVGPILSETAVDTGSVGTKSFTVNAADNAGHTESQTVTYDVTYGVCVLFDQTQAKPAGSTIPGKLQLCGASKPNDSSSVMAPHSTSTGAPTCW